MMLRDKVVPHCSFCNSENVSIYSSFGTAQLVRQYYCQECHSVFEFIRWQNVEDTEPQGSNRLSR